MKDVTRDQYKQYLYLFTYVASKMKCRDLLLLETNIITIDNKSYFKELIFVSRVWIFVLVFNFFYTIFWGQIRRPQWPKILPVYQANWLAAEQFQKKNYCTHFTTVLHPKHHECLDFVMHLRYKFFSTSWQDRIRRNTLPRILAPKSNTM